MNSLLKTTIKKLGTLRYSKDIYSDAITSYAGVSGGRHTERDSISGCDRINQSGK